MFNICSFVDYSTQSAQGTTDTRYAWHHGAGSLSAKHDTSLEFHAHAAPHTRVMDRWGRGWLNEERGDYYTHDMTPSFLPPSLPPSPPASTAAHPPSAIPHATAGALQSVTLRRIFEEERGQKATDREERASRPPQ